MFWRTSFEILCFVLLLKIVNVWMPDSTAQLEVWVLLWRHGHTKHSVSAFVPQGHPSTGAPQDSRLRINASIYIKLSAIKMRARTRRQFYCFALIWCFRHLKNEKKSFMHAIIIYWLPTVLLYLRHLSWLSGCSSKQTQVLVFGRPFILVGGDALNKQIHNVP